MNMKVDAEVAANALKKKMKGKGWKTEVWDNMGWEYHVKNGPITVLETNGGYIVLIGDNGCGNGCWTGRRGVFKDPNDAVRNALRQARRQLDECIKIVKTAEKVVGKSRRR